jgi:hypothetical protein
MYNLVTNIFKLFPLYDRNQDPNSQPLLLTICFTGTLNFDYHTIARWVITVVT